MIAKLLTEHHLEFLSLKVHVGCTGSTESTFVKIPHCWKSHVVAQLYLNIKKNVAFIFRGNTPDTKGTAFVVYEDIFDAKNACDHLSGFNVCNRYLVVLYYQSNKVSFMTLLTHLFGQMEFSALNNGKEHLHFNSCWVVFFIFIQILIEDPVSKQWRP